MIEKELPFDAGGDSGRISAILLRPDNAGSLLVFAPGASAGIRHGFMQAMAHKLAAHGIASFRYHFPYMEAGRKTPDRQTVLIQTVRSAVAAARAQAGDLPLLAGGKSLGGRMTSTAAGQDALPGVRGIVFFGFPLHAPGKPSDERGRHLFEVGLPMLFLQGTRDKLADLTLLRPLCERLQTTGRVTLHIVEGGDHSFHVPKRLGRSDDDVMEELADVTAAWSARQM